MIEGGQTMNPSVGQILEGVTAVNAEHVIVLPNNSNVRLAAENAAAESTKDVRVVADELRAGGDRRRLRVRRGQRTSTRTRRRCASAIEGLAVGEIVQASRDATVDGIAAAEGDFLAMLDGRAFAASPELGAVLDALLDRFAQDGRSLRPGAPRRGRARGGGDRAADRGSGGWTRT